MKDKYKNIIKYFLFTVIAVSLISAFIIDEHNEEVKIDHIPITIKSAELKNKIIVSYFHNNERCVSCLKIEKYSYEAIQKKYESQLKDGTLEWQVINIENPENSHYIKDYNLYTQSLVISLVKDREQKSWKNLEPVWQLINDKDKFYVYVQDEIDKYFKLLQ